jgi:hypothetical protein
VVDLGAIHSAVRRAQAEQRHVPPGVESAPWRPIESYLTSDKRRTVRALVAELRRRHLPTFNRFVGEQRVALLLVEILAELERPPSWHELAAELEERANAEGA